ncbi:glycosyltransferase family 1 protein [Streptomyces kanamyceticus]|uniref:D-inositol 3-phosphate glycosyltransferase n=1 Tax=Streptomyces kanamyceticus TaxID=1967 RepID=A0A5J6GTH8_STRKN|nr:glycosyltransferase family 1 protein [Streptomyces kanamyceticus]
MDQPPGGGMDIALVHWSFPPSVGGVESHLWDYSRLLARRGNRVTVLTGTPGAQCPGQPGVEVLTHPALDLARLDPGPDDARRLTRWFSEVLLQRGIRLVHCHNLHHFSAAPAQALEALRTPLRLALCHTYHSIWGDPGRGESVLTADRWDRHYAVSEFLRTACADVLGVRAERTYLGIDTAPYARVAPLDVAPQPGTVLLPARLIPDKGALLAVRALDLIVRCGMCVSRPRLLLTDTRQTVDFHGEKIGFRERVEKEIEKRDLESYVEFVEAGVDQMPDLYAESTVVVYPSLFDEPMGLAPLEAMCAARPVVVTRMGGLDEGVDNDGVIGYLVPDRDEEQLAARLAELLDDRETGRLMGLRGRAHVTGHFDLRKIYLKRMQDEYRALLAGRGGAPAGPDGASAVRAGTGTRAGV